MFGGNMGNMLKQAQQMQARMAKLKEVKLKIAGVKKVLTASGVSHDLALRSPEYINELVSNHTGGHLKIAPEHFQSPQI